MSNKKGNQLAGYFEYVVPQLEGLWWVSDREFSFTERNNWRWTLMIRQPDFVTQDFFAWACTELKKKKPGMAVEKARLEMFSEGLCCQALHMGPYAAEPETIEKIEFFATGNGYRNTFYKGGKHHEIYLSDPRKGKPENLKTVLRHPVEKC